MAVSDLEKIGDGVDRLPVQLTETELLEHGRRLAKLNDDFSEHEKAFESLKSQFKAKERELEARREQLSLAIRDGSVMRDVPVEHWNDYRARTRFSTRLDTGERYFSRPLAAEELQESLFKADRRNRAKDEADDCSPEEYARRGARELKEYLDRKEAERVDREP